MIKNILLLCTMLAPLCVSAQQTLAEITHGHPKIENLIKYADSLGIHIRKGYRISDSDSGIRYDKTVKLDFVLGDTLPNSRHTVPHATSSLFLDSIRSTFMSLIPSASESYAREHHHNGTDSIIYIRIQCQHQTLSKLHKRQEWKHGVPASECARKHPFRLLFRRKWSRERNADL